MKEIGGYFGLEEFHGREYHEGLIGVNSARNALLYILKARGVKKLYIPRFLCDTVARLCDREGYAYEEYPIDEGFLPVFDRELAAGEWLYIVNFYGRISDAQLLAMKERWGRVIVDNVQAFFHRPLAGVDTVYSCRKFFGVPDGGYVSCDAAPLALEGDYSAGRMKHVLGRFEHCGSAFYGEFQANDESFYDLPLLEMSKLTRNILRAVDYEEVKRRREANYAILEAALGARNRLPKVAVEGPYAYPFYCENGMRIKKALAAHKIYVATLWPNVLGCGGIEEDYARNILPLPCDQRYGEADMEWMAQCLKALL